MDYKIIVLDSDGTLTSRDKIITPRTKEALMKVQGAGNVVVLVSDRPAAGVEPLARELELSYFGSYILSYSGGMITNCKTGEIVFSSLLSREPSQKIIGLAKEHRIDILIYEGGEIIANNEECPYAIAESNINYLPLRQVEDMKSYVDFEVSKFLMPGDDDYLVTVEPKAKATMGHDFGMYRSKPHFLEIMPKGISKAQSLARLLEVLGLEREQVIACDDGYNDLTMIKCTDLSTAIENAVPPVKQAADYITTPNNHDGAGVVVEKFILS